MIQEMQASTLAHLIDVCKFVSTGGANYLLFLTLFFRKGEDMKKRVKRALVSLTLVASLVLTGVSTNPGAQTAQAAKKATIKLNKTSVKVKHGKKVTLKVTAKNAKIKSKKYSWRDYRRLLPMHF